jgi:hypothetical protein
MQWASLPEAPSWARPVMIPSASPGTTTEPPVKRLARRPLTVREILTWADLHRERTGKWPVKTSGGVADAKFETWANVDHALRVGLRALPARSSLARLLAEQRGVRNIHGQPPLTVEQILAWADAHLARTGAWPTKKSGFLPEAKNEKWCDLDGALQHGRRGLPGGSSLPKLLAEHRGVRNRMQLPPLTDETILAWADAHRQRSGAWPTAKSGAVTEASGETWMAIQMALNHGHRGLPGGSSLALLLADQRGVRNTWSRPLLSVEEILRWADVHHARTRAWPTSSQVRFTMLLTKRGWQSTMRCGEAHAVFLVGRRSPSCSTPSAASAATTTRRR